MRNISNQKRHQQENLAYILRKAKITQKQLSIKAGVYPKN